jgi:hypothetical protein
LDSPCDLPPFTRVENEVIGDDDGDGWEDGEGGDKGGVPGGGDDDGEGEALAESVEPTNEEGVSSERQKWKEKTNRTLTVMTPLTPMSRVIPARTFSVTLLSPETNVETAPWLVTTPPTTTLTPPSIVCE